MVTRFPSTAAASSASCTGTATGQLQVGEAQAKAILRAYDFNVPPGQPGHDRRRGGRGGRADRLPVAMKIASPDIIHKSDIGGVKLNLASPSRCATPST
jgi:acyl-CoA synthetase (NDP forming)